MPKAVIDTNLLISALIGRLPSTRQVLDQLYDQRYVLITSDKLLAELSEVLARPKLWRYLNQQRIVTLIAFILREAEFVFPDIDLQLCRDPKDNILLNVAATARADFLVTGDKDLLDEPALRQTMLADYGVEVITASEFLRRV